MSAQNETPNATHAEALAGAHGAEHGHGGAAEAEDDHPKITSIVSGFVVIVLSIVVTVVLVYQYFGMEVRDETAKKVLTHPDSLLREQHAVEEHKLGRYQWVDKKAGFLRIPIDRARELTVRDWRMRPTVLPPVDSAEPAASSAPAQAGSGAAPSASAAPAASGSTSAGLTAPPSASGSASPRGPRQAGAGPSGSATVAPRPSPGSKSAPRPEKH